MSNSLGEVLDQLAAEAVTLTRAQRETLEELVAACDVAWDRLTAVQDRADAAARKVDYADSSRSKRQSAGYLTRSAHKERELKAVNDRYDAAQSRLDAFVTSLTTPAFAAPVTPAMPTASMRPIQAPPSYLVEEIKQLLNSALVCLDLKGNEGSAAWRLADAGVLLRQMLEAQGKEGTGITTPTGRGALLPHSRHR